MPAEGGGETVPCYAEAWARGLLTGVSSADQMSHLPSERKGYQETCSLSDSLVLTSHAVQLGSGLGSGRCLESCSAAFYSCWPVEAELCTCTYSSTSKLMPRQRPALLSETIVVTASVVFSFSFPLLVRLFVSDHEAVVFGRGRRTTWIQGFLRCVRSARS